jgi:hypothetical protein
MPDTISARQVGVKLKDDSIVYLDRGQVLPEDIADGERDKLAQAGALGGAAQPLGSAAAPFDATAVDPHTVDPAAASPDGFDVRLAPTSQVAAFIESEKLTGPATVDLAEGDPALAQKVLDAEKERAGGDPRDNVAGPLQKIIDGDGS